MAIDRIDKSEAGIAENGHHTWAGIAADAYSPKSAVPKPGKTIEAGLAPAGPWCNPNLPPMTHEQLMQSWGLPSTSTAKPEPMPYDPAKPPKDGFYGNPNPGQKGREHPDPTIQPCEGAPPVAMRFKPSDQHTA